MPCFFALSVMVLDCITIVVLLLKTVVLRSASGLSYDMFVCMILAGLLFSLPAFEYILHVDFIAIPVVMICYAVALCVSFFFYLKKASAEVPMGPHARPVFLRWYTLFFVSVLLGVVFGKNEETDLAQTTLLVPLYLDAAGRLPQLWLVAMEPHKKEVLTCWFLAFVIGSRLLEALGWIVQFHLNNMVVLLPSMLQAAIGIDFLYFWLPRALFDTSLDKRWRMSVEV